MSDISQHSETLALHAGSHRRDPPLIQLQCQFTKLQVTNLTILNMQASFLLCKIRQYIHAHHDPTTQVLEERLAAIEGGVAALAVSSGSSAVALAIQNVASSGDNIIASPHLYGGTYNLFTSTSPNGY